MNLHSNPYSTRSQMMILLLGALVDRKGAYTKQDVLAIIEGLKWFEMRQEDKLRYPTVQSDEPRWKTLIAFTRKDCVEDKLFEDDECRDSWQISQNGMNEFVRLRDCFASGELDCSKCYMWSHVFKKHMRPEYAPSGSDKDRPGDIYRDYYYKSNRFDKYLSMLDDL